MTSKFNRTSFISRVGTTATIGALALVTGACAGGEDSDAGATEDVDGSEPTEAVSDADVPETAEDEAGDAASTDSSTSTDVPVEIMDEAPAAVPDSDAS